VPATRPAPSVLDEVRGLIMRAQHGDKTAAPLLRSLIARDPELVQLGAGDVAAQVKSLLVRRAVPGDVLGQQAKLAWAESIGAELAGASPTPIERLLAERAAFCLLEMTLADALVVGAWGNDLHGPRAAHLDRYRGRCQHRYMAALKMLAVVRKLPVAAVQLNVTNRIN
jgi:hypothetical protein